MTPDPDVWGAIVRDAADGKRTGEVIERDDGLLLSFDGSYFVAPFRRWDDPLERRAMRFVRGRVLDVGCGAGRACLHLQGRGLDVVGIDSSPGAIEVCRERGVRDARVVDIAEIDERLGVFDTVVMLGQNLGLLGTPARGRRLLARLARVTSVRGRIVAEGYDPHGRDEDFERAYRERNVARGRLPGQQRLRVRYRNLASAWLDWLQLAPTELEELVAPTAWRVARVLGDGPSYVALLEKR